MEKLNGFFIHSDATLLQTAAEACRHLLTSRTAVTFLGNSLFLLNPVILNLFFIHLLEKYPLLKVFETGIVTELPLHQNEQQLNFEKLFSDDAFRNTHSFWVKSLAIELFTLFNGEPLSEVAAKQTQFSMVMVPLLIKTVLATNNASYHKTLSTAINRFFAKTFEKLSGETVIKT